MSKGHTDEPALVFKALSDPTRLRLLNLLAEREVCVCDLHDTLRVVQPKVSRHLAQLRCAGLVDARRNGKWMYYRLTENPAPLVRHVLAGLRAWVNEQPKLKSERQRLGEVCCWNDKTRGRQTKHDN